jgi:hypothetical protein
MIYLNANHTAGDITVLETCYLCKYHVTLLPAYDKNYLPIWIVFLLLELIMHTATHEDLFQCPELCLLLFSLVNVGPTILCTSKNSENKEIKE